MEPAVVLYMQRQMLLGPPDAGPVSFASPRGGVEGVSLGRVLFHPLAGDSARPAPPAPPRRGRAPPVTWSRRGRRRRCMGCASACWMLAAAARLFSFRPPRPPSESLLHLSVARITNPACTETPGCLADLRMGASAITNRRCETCQGTHHGRTGPGRARAPPFPTVRATSAASSCPTLW